MPFEKNKAINGYILGYGARAYEEGRPIGDYCHEVVLAELGQGCIINHNLGWYFFQYTIRYFTITFGRQTLKLSEWDGKVYWFKS